MAKNQVHFFCLLCFFVDEKKHVPFLFVACYDFLLDEEKSLVILTNWGF